MMVFFIMIWPALLFAGEVDLPKTGQTTCYDENGNVIDCADTGQDGEIQAGVDWPEPRFEDNGDGTITDHLTGLIWLRDANCFGNMPWQQALDAVADFNANPGSYGCGGYTANYSDWRLPNVVELESLVNAEEPYLYAWLNTQGFSNVRSSWYWSATTHTDVSSFAWIVCMRYGHVYSNGKSNSHYVWPVRAGQ